MADSHPKPSLTVDVAILTVHLGELQVLMVTRGNEPFRGRLALPGGFVDEGEDLVDAALRELEEETGMGGVGSVPVEQLRTYATPGRDPRGWVVSVAHVAVVPEKVVVRGMDDAVDAGWYAIEDLVAQPERLAFDHEAILTDTLEWVRRRLEHTSLATAFVGETFALSELRGIYEAVWGRELDPGDFQRKVRQTEDLVVASGETRLSPTGKGRPATLYRAAQSEVHDLNSPIMRG